MDPSVGQTHCSKSCLVTSFRHTYNNIKKTGNDKNNSKYIKEKDSMKKNSKIFYLNFFLLHRFFFHMFDIQFVQLQTLSDTHAFKES